MHPVGQESPVSLQDISRSLQVKCNDNEEKIKFRVRTDKYGYETSWELRDGNSKVLSAVKPNTYVSNKKYEEVMCLRRQDYTLVVRDIVGDGMCCTKGRGNFKVFHEVKPGVWKRLFTVKKFKSEIARVISLSKLYSNDSFNDSLGVNSPPKLPTNQSTKELIDHPTRAPTRAPTNKPTQNSKQTKLIEPDTAKCTSSQRQVKVEIKTDTYGEDTSWEVTDIDGSVLIKSYRVYGKFDEDETSFCLEEGHSYDFVIRDSVGDGMCCQYGNGYFKVHLKDNSSWREILAGGDFKKKEVKQIINLKERVVNERDQEWLDSHNIRRKEWHEKFGKSYVPLKWSDGLAKEAMIWAEKLLDSCGKGMYHDPDLVYGENVAGNSGSGSWGAKRTTEQVLSRFVEREVDLGWPRNSHLTQVIWRSSKYLGCAEASKPMGGQGTCHTQVCRYSRPGNCQMSSYHKNNDDEWWMEPMLMDDTPCGPECPPDGCY